MPRSKANAKPSEKTKGLEPAKKNLASQKISRKSAPVTTGVKAEKKKRRSRPGQAALREIKKYQKSTDLLIQRAPLQRRSKHFILFSPTNCWGFRQRWKRRFERQKQSQWIQIPTSSFERYSRSPRIFNCEPLRRCLHVHQTCQKSDPFRPRHSSCKKNQRWCLLILSIFNF